MERDIYGKIIAQVKRIETKLDDNSKPNLIIKSVTSTAKDIDANATVIFNASDGISKPTETGYTKLTEFVTCDKDLITLGVHDYDSTSSKGCFVTAHNFHSAQQSVTITVNFVMAKDDT